MNRIKLRLEQFFIAKQVLRWTVIIAPVSITIGLLVSVFLWLLEWANVTRWHHLWLISILPIAGLLIHWLYTSFGKKSIAGNNLIIDEIHKPEDGVPLLMTPLILFTTIITHLFGGSAGREGVAIQIGGGISSFYSKLFKLKLNETRILLMCGMAAGFGAIFGTPVTGAIFALEVLAIGIIKYDALIPCLIASVLADITCLATGITHTHYTINYLSRGGYLCFNVHFDLLIIFKVIIAGVIFGLTSYLFAILSHFIKYKSNSLLPKKWMIPLLASLLIWGISYLIGSFDYLGLGVDTPNKDGVSIINAFSSEKISYYAWFWKLLLTAITLGMGFKGGEVTPLFFIGATLGNTIALLSGSPIDLFAALGFIAVFAGATNTPIACTFMGIELFGSENTIYYAIACFTSYYFSGHSGIYQSQRIAISKFNKENKK